MSNAFYHIPEIKNEPVLNYAPGSAERKAIKLELEIQKATYSDIPMVIGGKDVFTDEKKMMHPPHELSHTLGQHAVGDASHVKLAIEAALAAKDNWENMPWQERAAIFLKAADLLAGPYRAKMNAATMLCQSKNIYQAEIDAVCELADFYRFNVQFLTQIYNEQPQSAPGIWNRMEYRPLEGFVFALSPFNFTSIAGNLCGAPALMGNVCVWKPAENEIYSAHVIMEILKEAGLPDGVINLVYVRGKVAGDVIFSHPDFAGLHFTGSTGVFQNLWKTIGQNLSNYRTYPRIVGETGGKDFILAHPSADEKAVAVAMIRGSFEYQGQKCSASSRAYIPSNIWESVKSDMDQMLDEIKIGTVENFSNYINAVIDEKAFDKIAGFIDNAKKATDAEVIFGGGFSKENGYFIEPTVILAKDPKYVTMCEELFGPVLTVFVYDEADYEATVQLVDETSDYALTGAIFSQDRNVIDWTTKKLRYAAGNFYINDKPTGAVVGQQPFGGARASGTNDKAGSVLNLYRWISPRTIKETLNPPHDYSYPFLSEE